MLIEPFEFMVTILFGTVAVFIIAIVFGTLWEFIDYRCNEVSKKKQKGKRK